MWSQKLLAVNCQGAVQSFSISRCINALEAPLKHSRYNFKRIFIPAGVSESLLLHILTPVDR